MEVPETPQIEIRPSRGGHWSWTITAPAPLNEANRAEPFDLDEGTICYWHRDCRLSLGNARTRRGAERAVRRALKRIEKMRAHFELPPLPDPCPGDWTEG